ncbi:MAG: tetratricopeptide repeat protein [Anaerolineae bacterium]
MKAFILLIAALLITVSSAYAQESMPSADVHPYVASTPLPPSARLTGLRPVYQQFNRCSAAALTIHLSYFGWQGTYSDTIRALNPNAEDVAVRLDEMVDFAAQQGLSGLYRNGGTLDLLRALVAGGFPVLMENVYYDGPNAFNDWMSHNRVVMGYDDAKQEIYVFDSLLGNGPDDTGRPIPYADIDSRWRPFNRDFMVLYRPEDEAKVESIVGDYWDATYANEVALQLSQQELDGGNSDSFTLFNMGSSLVDLGRYAEAADAFDRARGIGLPFRMMWYQYGPFEAYYHEQRYDDMLTLARDVIATTPGVEESYYYAGLAYEAEGDLQRAKSNFEVAAWRNPDFTLAKQALTRVGG